MNNLYKVILTNKKSNNLQKRVHDYYNIVISFGGYKTKECFYCLIGSLTNRTKRPTELKKQLKRTIIIDSQPVILRK